MVKKISGLDLSNGPRLFLLSTIIICWYIHSIKITKITTNKYNIINEILVNNTFPLINASINFIPIK